MVVPLLNIPIISVVLLLLAGILIGHLIWYRDRSDDEATLVDLRSENNELQGALHEHKQAYVELEATLEDRRKGWEQLKAANQQLEQAQQSNHHDLTEINNELARLQQLKDQAFHDLDQERQQRRALQDALGQAEENTARANSLTDQLQSQIANFDFQNRETEERTNFLAERAELEEELRSQLSAVTEERNAVTEERNSLTRERDALLHRLESGREDAQLISKLQSQTETLRQQVQDSEASLTQLQSEVKTREEELASLREERDMALSEVEDERTGRSNLERQVQNVEQLVAQRDDAIARATKLEEETAQAKVRIEQLSESLEGNSNELLLLQNSHEDAKLELKQETDVLRQKLTSLSQEHEAVSQVLIDERSRLSSMESENHRLSTMAAEAEAKATSNNEELRSTVARKQVEIDTLRTELEDVASQLSRERHQREHLQTVLHEQKNDTTKFDEERQQFELQVNSLTSKNESLLSQAAELLSLRGEYSAAESQISTLTAELSELRQQQDVTYTERNAMAERVDELNRQISQLTSQLAQVRVEREEQVSELDRLQQTHRTALASRMELESAKDELEQQTRQLSAELAEAREVNEANNDLKTQLETALAQRAELEGTQEQLQRQTQQLSAELDEARELKPANVDLKTRLDKVILQRDEAMKTHAEQETQLAQLERQLDEVNQRSDEHDDLRRSYLQLQTQANDSADRLRRITVERDSQRDALRNAESRLSQLEERSKSNEETIRNLRRERAAVLANNARQPSTVAFSSLSTRSVPERDSGGRMRRDEVLGMVYTQPPKRKDDLKRISGIAQVLEKKLNAFGVYTYRQVMEWDQVAIAEFSKLLSFRDRIERDDWIGQARNLQYETYGRAA